MNDTLALKRDRIFNQKELSFIKENYGTLAVGRMAKMLGCSVSKLDFRIKLLGFKKNTTDKDSDAFYSGFKRGKEYCPVIEFADKLLGKKNNSILPALKIYGKQKFIELYQAYKKENILEITKKNSEFHLKYSKKKV